MKVLMHGIDRRVSRGVAMFGSAALIASVACPTSADDAARQRVRAAEAERVAIFEKCSRAVVCIFADSAQAGGGSGVVISPEGYGLTNVHVVQEFLDKRHGVGGLSDGHLYPLRVLGIDPGGDIAMFKLSGKDRFDFAPLGDSDQLVVGQYVAAMGNPFLTAEDFQPTITLGNISGLHRYQGGSGNVLEYADCIQVATSINPGNSGGPLFDLQGRIVGIIGRASFEERGRVNVGLGYAVTMNQIKRFLPGLRAGRVVEHGTLGITVRNVGDDLIINAIQDFSPADKAGLKLGDALLSVGGRPMRTPNDFNNVVTIHPAGWPIAVRARRDGRDFEVTARLERLIVRMQMAYVLDLEHNHAELHGILARSDDLLGSAPRGVKLSGQVTPASGTAATFDATLAATSGVSISSPVLDEWLEIARPLAGVRKIDLDWEFIGGDELGGRIVNVIERRTAEKQRARWYFDFESGRFAGASLDRGADTEPIIWVVSAELLADGLPWPKTWSRRGPENALHVIEFLSAQAIAEPTATQGESGQ